MRASLAEVAAALAVLTGEPHLSGHDRGVVNGMAAVTIDKSRAADPGVSGPLPARNHRADRLRTGPPLQPGRDWAVQSWPLLVPAAAEVWSGWVGDGRIPPTVTLHAVTEYRWSTSWPPGAARWLRVRCLPENFAEIMCSHHGSIYALGDKAFQDPPQPPGPFRISKYAVAVRGDAGVDTPRTRRAPSGSRK